MSRHKCLRCKSAPAQQQKRLSLGRVRTWGKGGQRGSFRLRLAPDGGGPQAVRSAEPPATSQSPAFSALSNVTRSPGRCTSWYPCIRPSCFPLEIEKNVERFGLEILRNYHYYTHTISASLLHAFVILFH